MSRVRVANGDRVLSLLLGAILFLGNNCLGWGTFAGPLVVFAGASEIKDWGISLSFNFCETTLKKI